MNKVQAFDEAFRTSKRKPNKCTHNMPAGCCAICISERKAQDIDVPYERDPWDQEEECTSE